MKTKSNQAQIPPPEEITYLLHATLCRIHALARDKNDEPGRQLIWAIADASHNLPLAMSDPTSGNPHGAADEIKTLKTLLRQRTEHTTDISAQGDTPMRLTNTVKQWVVEKEWSEVPVIDEEQQTSTTDSGITIGDFKLKLFFEIMEKGEIFKIYAYFFDAKVPEKKLAEVQKLVTEISNQMVVGTLQLLRDDRVIRYYGAIDVENATFEPAHITNLLNAGLRTMENNLPRYMAVCFGGKTADEALEMEN